MDNEGVVTMVYRGKKKSYYVCDLGPKKGGMLRQSRLSFPMKITPEDNPSKDDTKGGSS